MISPTKAVSDPVAGRQVGDPPMRASPAPCSPARYRNMASRGGRGSTQRHSLSTCHPNGAPIAVKEDTAVVAKLLFVRLISKDRKIIVCLSIVLIWVTIGADLVSSGALEDVIRVVRVAELTLIEP